MHRTTILLEPILFNRLRNKAAKEGKTLTKLIQHFLREGLNRSIKKISTKKVALPSFSMGKPKVDVNDRNQLWDIMDQS